ncbi:MAG: divergent polysaccharide deacetylase family protein [Psychrobium sp.]
MKVRFLFVSLIALIGSSFSHATVTAKPKNTPRIAIVIDDIGYRKTDFSALDLSGQFTYSVVPFAPFTQTIANAVHDSSREVMAHIPMEAVHNNHLLGKGALKLAMTEQQTRQQVQDIIADIPHVSGINNHMGSQFTTKPKNLAWLMDEISHQQLYFLDSKTTAYSMAEKVAVEHGLRTGHRHIFLDNQLDTPYLTQQFNQLIKIAKKHHYAIAIAHPHPQSIRFLKEISAKLSELGVELVPVSALLPEMTRIARARHLDNKTGANKRYIGVSATLPK